MTRGRYQKWHFPCWRVRAVPIWGCCVSRCSDLLASDWPKKQKKIELIKRWKKWHFWLFDKKEDDSTPNEIRCHRSFTQIQKSAPPHCRPLAAPRSPRSSTRWENTHLQGSATQRSSDAEEESGAFALLRFRLVVTLMTHTQDLLKCKSKYKLH